MNIRDSKNSMVNHLFLMYKCSFSRSLLKTYFEISILFCLFSLSRRRIKTSIPLSLDLRHDLWNDFRILVGKEKKKRKGVFNVNQGNGSSSKRETRVLFFIFFLIKFRDSSSQFKRTLRDINHIEYLLYT